jgi:predicted ATPase/DNA-binding SARP family transcriptional activator
VLFRVLGPLEVDSSEGIVVPAGPRARALLTALLLEQGAVVPVHRLAEAVWGEEPPARVENAVHVVVGRARRALGPAGARLVTRAPGYQLDLGDARIDADLFEQRCRAARALSGRDPAAAARLLDEALGLWRGPAYGEFGESFARPAAVRLDELRRAADEDRAEALLQAGAVEDAVAAARDLAAAHPMAERPTAVLMRALSAAGRTGDALDAYQRHLRVLRDELGIDPPAELRELHTRILREEVGPTPRQTARDTTPPGRSQLPRRPSPLIGREDEVRTLSAAVADPALVTLLGPGGVGKTRVALEVAHQCAAASRPVWWVDLVPVQSSRLLEAVAAATGVEIASGRDPVDALCTALAAHRGVLVLDNAEHVLDALAVLVERLRDGAPGLALLVTSRERLALDTEEVQRMAPLPLPTGADPDNPAVRLFLARAPGLALPDEAGLALVAQVCRRLDGLPLAIELGAARAGGLGLTVLLDRMGERLEVLGGGRRTADRRHRTLRAVVDWSHDLLDPEEAVLFRRLGVFPGSFTLDQVEAVCGGASRGSLPALLARLVEQSLVQPARSGRFQLLETLRAFTLERLAAAGEEHALRDAHARDTAARLAATSRRLWSEHEGEAVGDLTALTPDLHTAWAHALAHDRPLALRLAGDVYEFAYFRQRLDLLRWGLPIADWPIDDPELAAALGTAAAALWSAGRMTEASATAERGITLAGGPDAPAAALPMNVSGDIAMFIGDTDDAIARYRRHAELRRARGQPVLGLVTELSVAHALVNAGRAEEAATVVAELLPQAVRSAVPTVMAWAHYLAGEAASETDPERAAASYRTAIEHGLRADSRLFVTMARTSAAALAARTGALREALAGFPVALEEWVQLGNQSVAWWLVQHVTVLLERAGAHTDAAVLAGAVLARENALAAIATDAERLQAALAAARERLGEHATTAALERGAGLTDAAVVARAQQALADAAATMS